MDDILKLEIQADLAGINKLASIAMGKVGTNDQLAFDALAQIQENAASLMKRLEPHLKERQIEMNLGGSGETGDADRRLNQGAPDGSHDDLPPADHRPLTEQERADYAEYLAQCAIDGKDPISMADWLDFKDSLGEEDEE